MSDTMLIAYDGSPEAVRALEYAGRFLKASRAILVTAWEPVKDASGQDSAHELAVKTSEEGVAIAQKNGIEAEPYLVESATTIWNAIIDAAQKLDADLIVAGTRGMTGIKAMFQPSVADNILKHSGLPVFIVPPAA